MSVEADSPRTTTGLIEVHSYDYIPTEERHGTGTTLLPLWFGENAHILAAVTGAVGIALGLNLWWTLVAIVVGNVVGALFMAFHSAQGPILGLPQMIQSRAQFGFYGGLLPVVLAVGIYFVYGAAGSVPAGQAFQVVFGGSLNVWLIVVTVPMLILAVYGYDFCTGA